MIVVPYTYTMDNFIDEVWKELPPIKTRTDVYNVEGYEISNYGRLRTKRQQYGRPRKDIGRRRDMEEYRLVKGRLDNYGYIQYNLYDDQGRKRNFRPHRLVMQAFVGYPEPGFDVICHYDDNKLNNHISNLRYGTYKDNIQDAIRNGTFNAGRKKSNI